MTAKCYGCGDTFKSWGSLANHAKYAKNGCTEEARFWGRVNKIAPNGCWVWTGYVQRFGHGWLGRRGLAHRYAWELLHGELPADKCLLHHCDNPPCVNPEHLFIGDRTDNMADMRRKGRGTYGEKNPTASITEEQAKQILVKFRRYGPRESNVRELAKEMGCTEAVVYNVAAGRTWKHLSRFGDNER